MKNKGFTLIELLAVIVILAIIALIATPIVLNIIKDAKESSTLRSADFYIDALENEIMLENTKQGGSFNPNVCEINKGKVLCDEKEINLKVNGEIPTSGSITFEEGKVIKVDLTYPSGNVILNNKGELVLGDVNIPEPKSFAEDSWDTIAANVRKGNIDVYKSNLENNKNNTKKIELTIDGTKKEYTVRIANTTTPPECNSEGFSQTACGFVVEFEDIIKRHNMNPSGEYKGVQYDYGWNKDGYPASSMYKFLNDETDKEITSIYELLPEEIKNVIIPTFVVSSYGSEDTSNFTSTDKLYLLATGEIWAQGTSNTIDYDEARNKTRQLDYYIGVTTDSFGKAKKYYNGSADVWWLRSATSHITSDFYRVRTNGDWASNSAHTTHGVAPAFRIG